MIDTLRSVGERTLVWQQGCYYWGDAIAYDGLLAADEMLDAGWSAELAGRIQHWFDSAPDSFDDSLVPGQAIARLVENGALSPGVLQRAVHAVTRLPRAEGVPLLRPHVPAWRTLVWVDSLYHVPATLVAASQTLNDPTLMSDGISIAAATVKVLSTEAAVGHAYETGLGSGTGVQWTRGIGWALLGLLDVLDLTPDEAGAAGLDVQARRLFEALRADQRPDGHWTTLLGEPAADPETSVAGFWAAAATHPAAQQWSVAGDRDAITRAVDALRAKISDDGTVHGVSQDTHVSWQVDDYRHPRTGPSPWGQGAALRGLVGTLRAQATADDVKP